MNDKVSTRQNVKFEKPLTETITIRVTLEEYQNLVIIAKQNEISYAELLRNLIRDNLYSYSISENLRKKLRISNKIDAFLLEKRLILDRNDTNLSKIREILTDFEWFLEAHPKKIDIVTAYNIKKDLDRLIKIIWEEDMWLSEQIHTQYERICKNKHFKSFSPNP